MDEKIVLPINEKNLMLLRLNYLNDNKHINISNSNLEEYIEFTAFIKNFFNECIKYNLDNKSENIIKSVRKLNCYLNNEKQILFNFI